MGDRKRTNKVYRQHLSSVSQMDGFCNLLRLTDYDGEIVIPSPSSCSMNNEETREVRSHSCHWEGDQEQHAVGKETMFDWNNLSQNIVEGNLRSRRKADECVGSDELTDSFGSGCYDDSHEGDC